MSLLPRLVPRARKRRGPPRGRNVAPLHGPGTGCELVEELWRGEDAIVETLSLKGRTPR